MTAELFTERHAKKGKIPAGMRDGTKLKKFQYIEAFIFPFIGVDENGVQHQWNGKGHKSDTTRNMFSDLVVSLITNGETLLYLALTDSGNGYANKDLEKLKAVVNKGSYDVYELIINAKKGTGHAKKIERVEL